MPRLETDGATIDYVEGGSGAPLLLVQGSWLDRQQWELVAAALTLGGNVRVGLEDNFYLPDGETARSNGDLIAKARQMTEDVGRKPATVAQARELLGLPDPGATRREVFAGATA